MAFQNTSMSESLEHVTVTLFGKKRKETKREGEKDSDKERQRERRKERKEGRLCRCE